jgi:hypothetical protein
MALTRRRGLALRAATAWEGVMVRKACLLGMLVIGLVNTGCCRWCERWCGHAAPTYAAPAPAAYAAPAQACVPCCPVVCCPSSPAPAAVGAVGGQWQRQPYCP